MQNSLEEPVAMRSSLVPEVRRNFEETEVRSNPEEPMAQRTL